MKKFLKLFYIKRREFTAFTLAEVLVTLGIIGVVAAMTMPTLVENHQRKVYVTQLQKVYTELSQAAKRAITDSNAVSLDETRFNQKNANGAKQFFTTYFNVVQDCGTTLTPCFADSYKTLTGEDFTYYADLSEGAVSLASGASINIWNNYLLYDSHDHGYIQFYVDINGAEGPNIVGRDLFYMELYSDGKVAESYNIGERGDGWASEMCAGGEEATIVYGLGCLTKIIEDGWVMDY